HVDLRDAAGNESVNLLLSRSGVGAAQVNAVAGSNPARRAVARFPLVDWSSFSQRLNLHAQPGFAFVFIRSNPECDIPRRRRKQRCKHSSESSSRAIRRNFAANTSIFSWRIVKPAAISWPPNFSSDPAQRFNASTKLNPSILRPLAFPIPFASNPITIDGR